MARGRRPRTVVSLLLTVVIVAGALWAVPRVLGDDRSPSQITGITWGTNGIDFAQPAPVVPGSVEGIRAMWPPVPVDAKDEPLGRPPLSQSASTDYVFMSHTGGPTSAPVAWDPCRPIHIVVNSADAPADADRLLAEAASEVSRATGLQFVVEGQTDEVPSAGRQPIDGKRYGNRWSPVLLAWTNPSVVPELAGNVAGIGGPRGATYAQSVDQHWVSGVVFLRGPTFASILTRSNGWSQARAIVMHELGHLIGLNHVEKRSELMYSDNVGKHAFGDGDLEGLRRLGTGRCFTK
ncbi:MAG: matrixin family metalloprotease [Pedococcus sp.]